MKCYHCGSLLSWSVELCRWVPPFRDGIGYDCPARRSHCVPDPPKCEPPPPDPPLPETTAKTFVELRVLIAELRAKLQRAEVDLIIERERNSRPWEDMR